MACPWGRSDFDKNLEICICLALVKDVHISLFWKKKSFSFCGVSILLVLVFKNLEKGSS
jgi:hypothetical protein